MRKLEIQCAEGSDSICRQCNKAIKDGDLKIECTFEKPLGHQKHHCQCLINTCSFDDCKKADILIALEKDPDAPPIQKTKYVSLEAYDKHPCDYRLDMSEEDVNKLREQISLAKEHKTAYYIPTASKTLGVIKCPQHYCLRNSSKPSAAAEEGLQLYFQEHYYHPKCLSNRGLVNVDAEEIGGYESLTLYDKSILDMHFKKDNNASCFPRVEETTSNGIEFCSYSKCLKVRPSSSTTEIQRCLRIRWRTKVYHTKCFAAMGKVDINAEEINNFKSLSPENQTTLCNHIKRSNNFDIPLLELSTADDCCNAAKCFRAKEPSKFPYPYTILKDKVIIKFHGEYYHPKCFKFENKVNMAVEDFLGYDNPKVAKKKWYLDKIFKKNDDDAHAEKDVMNDNDAIATEPPAKKSKITRRSKSSNARVEVHTDQETKRDTVLSNAGIRSPITESDLNALNESVSRIQDTVASTESSSSPPLENVETPANDDSDVEIIDSPPKPIKLEYPLMNDDDDDDIIFIESEPKTEIKEEKLDSAGNIAIFKYETPNDTFIQSTLDMLQFEINKESLYFWAKVPLAVLKPSSTPTSTFPISSAEDSFFKCLSCFLIGKEEQYLCIKRAVQSYFHNNFKSFGTFDGIDYSKLYVTSREVKDLFECSELTNVHFNFISSWLQCRIGIFSAGHGLQKYGNWNEERHPILLMENDHDFYKPVLTLS